MRRIWKSIRALVRPSAADRDVDREIEHFIDEAAAHYETRGLSAADARRAARVDMGSPAAARELVRSSGWDAPIRAVARDVRYGLRLLRRSPGFTLVAVALMALGIGSTTALFSVADEVLLRPLAVRAPGELVIFDWTLRPPFPAISVPVGIQMDEKSGGGRSTGFSYLTFRRLALEREWQSLAGIMAFSGTFPVRDAEMPDGLATGQVVSGNYYELLGVGARLGRVLTREDDAPTAPAVAVISHRYWSTRFGGLEHVLGQSVRLGSTTATIVGVTPASFSGTQDVGSSPDITVPVGPAPALRTVGPKNLYRMMSDAYIWPLRLMGRVRSGATPVHVASELQPAFQASALDSYRSDTPAGVQAPTLRVESGSRGLSDRRRSLGQFVA